MLWSYAENFVFLWNISSQWSLQALALPSKNWERDRRLLDIAVKRLLRKIVGPLANMNWDRLWPYFFMIGICGFQRWCPFQIGCLRLTFCPTNSRESLRYLYVMSVLIPMACSYSSVGTSGNRPTEKNMDLECQVFACLRWSHFNGWRTHSGDEMIRRANLRNSVRFINCELLMNILFSC